MLIKFMAQESVWYLHIQSAPVNFSQKLIGRGSEVSRGWQSWESHKKKVFLLSEVQITEVLLYVLQRL
jgi:hypothetical protein